MVELEAELAGTEQEGPSEKGLRPSKWRPSAKLEEDPSKEAEEKKVDTEVEILNRKPKPPTRIIVYTYSRKKSLKILAVSSNTKEDLTSLEELVNRVVEGVERTITEQQPVPSP